MDFLGALRAHKMLILLNLPKKAYYSTPPPPANSEEYSPMVKMTVVRVTLVKMEKRKNKSAW